MTEHFPNLFSPLEVGHLTLKNRIVSTSHDAAYGVGGRPGERYINYHVEKAKGGAALIQAFGTASPHPTSPGGAGNINVWDDSIIEPFQRLAERIHEHGAAVTCQLAHRGRRSSAAVFRQPALSPSDIPNERTGETPHVMTLRDIRTQIEAHAAAAQRVLRGGFDGVELCLYGDMLPDQFLSPTVNTRTDAYGGSFEKRLRFTLELVDATRAAIGPEALLVARITADDLLPGELSSEERLEVARRLDALGAIDLFSVLAGTIKSIAGRANNVPSSYFERATYLPLAAAVRAEVTVPVLYATRIVDPAEAEAAIASQQTDLVGMTRALIADPHMPNKARLGHADDIRACVGVNQGCIGRLYQGLPIECLQNPVIGREAELAEISSAVKRRRVVVIGGGPAGLEAARVAAIRGHSVTLLERRGELGGQVLIAARAPGREEFAGIARYLVKQVVKLGVSISTETDADADTVAALQPDAVIVATGARPRTTSAVVADGAEVMTAVEVLAGTRRPTSGPVIVLAEDPLKAGPTAADLLAREGHAVTILTPHYTVADGVDDTVKPILLKRLIEQGVTLKPLLQPIEVRPTEVLARHVLTGEEAVFPARSVVVACGSHADDQLFHALAGTSAELHLIGDAMAPRGVHDALLEATRAARLL